MTTWVCGHAPTLLDRVGTGRATVLLAAATGVDGARAHTLTELAALAKAAAGRAGPSVIHVAVPEHMTLTPPVATWQAAMSGGQPGRPIH